MIKRAGRPQGKVVEARYLMCPGFSIKVYLTPFNPGRILPRGGVERPEGILTKWGSSAEDGVQAQLDWEA